MRRRSRRSRERSGGGERDDRFAHLVPSWIWDRRSGLRSLGVFPGGNGNARATAINNSGTVAGFAEIITAAAQVTQAFRWVPPAAGSGADD